MFVSFIFHSHIRRRDVHNKNPYEHNSITNSETIGSGGGGGNGTDDDDNDEKIRIPTYNHSNGTNTLTSQSVRCSSSEAFRVCVGLSLCISRARTADNRERSESRKYFFRKWLNQPLRIYPNWAGRLYVSARNARAAVSLWQLLWHSLLRAFGDLDSLTKELSYIHTDRWRIRFDAT